mgnify:CR=1 FL=1
MLINFGIVNHLDIIKIKRGMYNLHMYIPLFYFVDIVVNYSAVVVAVDNVFPRKSSA